jgi:chromosome segregation ATPase
LFRVNLKLTAITNDGLTEELDAQNALLMEKLKYIAQLELELDQLRVQCNTLDELMVQSKDNETNPTTSKDQQDELRQEIHRLSVLLEEKNKALEKLTAELEAHHQPHDQQLHHLEQDQHKQTKDLAMHQMQQENRSLTSQVEQLGKFVV